MFLIFIVYDVVLVESVVLFLFLPVHLGQLPLSWHSQVQLVGLCLWKLELDHVEFLRRFIEQIWLVTFADY